VLFLRDGTKPFRAKLPRTSLPLANGSRLQLTGICHVETSTGNMAFRAKPLNIELLLRTPADIRVLETPSPWTVKRLSIAALVLLVFALGALIWGAMLRRRVKQQTEVIRRRIEREAMLEERQRVAREMHDTLAQSFSGVAFQLEAIDARMPTDSSLKNFPSTAKQLVRHGQEEFRRSLLNLRAQELERGDLPTALREIGTQMTAGSGIHFTLTENGRIPRLPEAVENNVLRVGQECIRQCGPPRPVTEH